MQSLTKHDVLSTLLNSTFGKSGSTSRESIDHLASCVADLKKKYKEITGESLKLSDMKSSDSMELVSGLSPRKVAYYRRMHVLELG